MPTEKVVPRLYVTIVASGVVVAAFLFLALPRDDSVRDIPPPPPPSAEAEDAIIPDLDPVRRMPPPPPPSSEAEDAIIPDLDAVRDSIFLLPGRGPANGISWRDRSLNEVFTPEQVAVVRATSFPHWQLYEDEYVAFRYPQSPHISLQVQEVGDKSAVKGGAAADRGDTSIRKYRLMIGKRDYWMVMLGKEEDFDDGTCSCGKVVYTKYLFRNGALYRFSLLEWHQGAIKRIQILRGGMRVVLFGWAHMPIHQEMYLKLALGMQLKGEPLDEEKARRAIIEKYGFAGRAGFLEKGLPRQRIKALLGAPAEETDSSLTYRTVSDDWYETTYRFPLEQGGLAGLREDWCSTKGVPPTRGSVAWIYEKGTGLRASMRPPDRDMRRVTADDARFIFERFLVLAPEASAKDWRSLCQAVCDLRDKGYRDDRVVPVVKRRFLDFDLYQMWAAWILAKYDREGSQELFVKR
ncbi:MAG: hypothetical protein ACYS9X_15310, partial [Planctomycetota bacterium]